MVTGSIKETRCSANFSTPWNVTTACYVNGDAWKQQLTEGEQLTSQFLKAGLPIPAHVEGASLRPQLARVKAQLAAHLPNREAPVGTAGGNAGKNKRTPAAN